MEFRCLLIPADVSEDLGQEGLLSLSLETLQEIAATNWLVVKWRLHMQLTPIGMTVEVEGSHRREEEEEEEQQHSTPLWLS